MFESSVIELGKSALKRNIRFLQKLKGPDAIFSAVIKGNAYGHGIRTFVPMAEECKIHHFSVFSADEAYRASSCKSRRSQLMIMGDVPDEALGWAVEHGISFYVFGARRVREALDTARKAGKKARVHLQLETGMNRMGLEGSSLQEVADILLANQEHFRVEGVCTHYAGAESIANYLRIQNQIKRFHALCEWIEKRGIHPKLRHTACSAAAISYPETIMDMVRFGIAMYGFWPSKETEMHWRLAEAERPRTRDPLRRVMRWCSRVMHLKDVEPGQFVGYGTSFLTTRKTRLACVPVGYFHGFARSLSNLGHVLIRGRRAPVVGLVNMNMILADITEIKDARRDDEVVIIGRQRKSHISVSSFSDLTRYLNYEVLTRIPSEIPRIAVD